MSRSLPIDCFDANARLSSGVRGLDTILCGGLVHGNAYAIQGGPGTGKTLLGLHFAACQSPQGARLIVTLGEDSARMVANARQLGIDLDGVELLDLGRFEGSSILDYRLVSPAETDFHQVLSQMFDHVRRLAPVRIFVDFARTLRQLSQDGYTYRRAMITLLSLFREAGATTLVASELIPGEADELAYMVDGVIELVAHPILMTTDRSVRVIKSRGSDFKGGLHSLKLGCDGVEVIPHILASVGATTGASLDQQSTGVPGLDAVVGGGIEAGTVTLLTGSSGTGKTLMGLQMMLAGSRRGQKSLVYSFDQDLAVMNQQLKNLGQDPTELFERKVLGLKRIEPNLLSADEFEAELRTELETEPVSMVMLDSTIGYQLAIRDEQIVARLHALCRYLQTLGVTVVLTTEIRSLATIPSVTDQRFSYMVDNVILLRHADMRLEGGAIQLRKLLLVLKKRLSDFDRTVQELEVGPDGLRVVGPARGIEAFFGEGRRNP